jgi:NADH dehydrogenase FAD-containing subunit
MMVWSTGVESLDFIKELDCPHDPISGRILIDSKLKIKNQKDVYSIGDCAMIEDQFYPPTAQVAD